MLGYWIAIFFVSIFSEVISTLYYCAMNAKVKHRTVFWSGIVSLVNLLLYRSVFREQGNAGLWLVSAMFLGDVIGTYLALTLEEHRDARRLAAEAASTCEHELAPQAIVDLQALQQTVAALSAQVAAQQAALAAVALPAVSRYARPAHTRPTAATARRAGADLAVFPQLHARPQSSVIAPPSAGPQVVAASPSMPGPVRRPTRPPLLPGPASSAQVA